MPLERMEGDVDYPKSKETKDALFEAATALEQDPIVKSWKRLEEGIKKGGIEENLKPIMEELQTDPKVVLYIKIKEAFKKAHTEHNNRGYQ